MMRKSLLMLSASFLLAGSIASLHAQETPTPMMGQGQPGAGGMMAGQGMMGQGMMGSGTMGHGTMSPAMMRMMVIMLDTNGDGALSLEEVQAVHARIFRAMDADKDGRLTPEEMQNFMQGQ
jgi:hypothetical protein